MEALCPHRLSSAAPLPPRECTVSSACSHHRLTEGSGMGDTEKSSVNKREKLQSSQTNSAETLLHTKRDLEPQPLEKKIWCAALIFNVSHWTETKHHYFFPPKQQIIANPLLHITYHLSPHQRLLESDGIKHSSQAVFVKSNNYIVTRIYN